MFTQIAVIGTGNIGNWLIKTLDNQSDVILFPISGRNIETLPPHCDLYIFSLKDDIYNIILQKIPFKMQNSLHTSGALSKNILAPYSENFGVLYPYQSICKKQKAECRVYHDSYEIEVPVCIEGSDLVFENRLFQWANSIFKNVNKIDEKQRFAMHLAAVFANNFTNAMVHIAYQIFKENDLDWSLIFPLLENTLEKAKQNNPSLFQTGPAIRNDISIMEKHGNALQDEDLKNLYQLVSKIIQKNKTVSNT
jgi:hypothetical protein